MPDQFTAGDALGGVGERPADLFRGKPERKQPLLSLGDGPAPGQPAPDGSGALSHGSEPVVQLDHEALGGALAHAGGPLERFRVAELDRLAQGLRTREPADSTRKARADAADADEGDKQLALRR